MAASLATTLSRRRPPLTLLVPALLLALCAPVAWLNWSGVWSGERAAMWEVRSSRAGGLVSTGDDGHFHWPTSKDLAAVWMSPDEASRILWALKPGMIYLEYGSGGSTMAFAPMAARAYSVEHSGEWCKTMVEKLAAHHLTARVRYVCSPIPAGTGGWGLTDPYEEGDYKVSCGEGVQWGGVCCATGMVLWLGSGTVPVGVGGLDAFHQEDESLINPACCCPFVNLCAAEMQHFHPPAHPTLHPRLPCLLIGVQAIRGRCDPPKRDHL